MKKFFKRIARVALPVLGSFLAPGIGTALGSTLSSAALKGIGGAIGGGLGGASSGGGLKSALTGAALGGAGGYLMGGGSVPGLGSMGGNLGAGGIGPATPSSGVLGSVGKAIGTGGATGSSIGGFIRPAASIYSGLQQSSATDEMEKQMLDAQGRASADLRPLQEQFAAGFDPSQLANDPGYQYRMQEGQKSLDRSLAAQGLGQSGAAIQAAQSQAQGLSQQQYDTAYNQWLQRMNPQVGLAGSQADLNIMGGMTRQDATGQQSNIMSKAIADLLSKEQLGRYI